MYTKTLGYCVFVSEPIPMNVIGPLPNGERHMFSPLASTLIYGKNDAVLVDPPLTTNQAKAVGDWVEVSDKNLTHIFATHGHGDYWFTACWPSGSGRRWPLRVRSSRCISICPSAGTSGTGSGPAKSRPLRSSQLPCPTTSLHSRGTICASRGRSQRHRRKQRALRARSGPRRGGRCDLQRRPPVSRRIGERRP